MNRSTCLSYACSLLLVVSPISFGCGTSSSPDADAGAVTEDLGDVVYEGDTNDEALKALVGASVQKGSTVAVTAPTANQVVPREQPFVFAWSDLKQASIPRTRSTPSWGVRILSLVEGTAYAHGEAVNGVGYFVTFSTPTNPKLLRVFTTKNGTVPSAASWEKMRTAKGPISVRLRAATFEESRIASGGGPFDGTLTTFSIQP